MFAILNLVVTNFQTPMPRSVSAGLRVEHAPAGCRQVTANHNKRSHGTNIGH